MRYKILPLLFVLLVAIMKAAACHHPLPAVLQHNDPAASPEGKSAVPPSGTSYFQDLLLAGSRLEITLICWGFLWSLCSELICWACRPLLAKVYLASVLATHGGSAFRGWVVICGPLTVCFNTEKPVPPYYCSHGTPPSHKLVAFGGSTAHGMQHGVYILQIKLVLNP